MPLPFFAPPDPQPELPPTRFAAAIIRDPAAIESLPVLAPAQTSTPDFPGVVLIGLPDDLGVRLNSGRPGAARGPAAFRTALASHGVARPHGWDWPPIYDAGDIRPVSPTSDDHDARVAALTATHDRISAAIAPLLARGLFPVAIGGGHDLTFPFIRAVAAAHSPLAGIYFDAHLDVRDTPGSGMPFRSLIQHCAVGPLIARGLSPFVNSREHVNWFKENRGKIDGWGPGRFDGPPKHCEHFFISFDLDVLDASAAPGVSAANPCGWDTQTANKALSLLAPDPRLRAFDIMELNPDHDADGRTAKVAARLFLTLVRGLAQRAAGDSSPDAPDQP